MLTSTQIFASKIFFLTWFKLSSETKLKKCVFKLSSFYFFIKSESLNHVRQDLIFSHFSWALQGVLAPKTNFFSLVTNMTTATNSQYGHITQRTKILQFCYCQDVLVLLIGREIDKQPTKMTVSYYHMTFCQSAESWENIKFTAHYPTTPLALEF